MHRLSGGIPRLINLICDRALLAGFSIRTNRITPEMVSTRRGEPRRAVADRAWPRPGAVASLTRRAPLVAAAAVVLLACALAVGASAYLYQRLSRALSGPPASAEALALHPSSPARPGDVSIGHGSGNRTRRRIQRPSTAAARRRRPDDSRRLLSGG